MFAVFRISIHRSLAGPDQRRYKRHQRDPISIHRSLAGPDNVVFVPSSAVAVFQSTGPLRDPTALNDGVYKKGEISIHRSLAGPDVLRLIYTASWGYFNPQVPCGTRPSEVLAPWVYDDFNPQVPCGTRRNMPYVHKILVSISIHRSLAGPDKKSGIICRNFNISIHRSLAGPDYSCAGRPEHCQNFNPQVPCGTRPPTAAGTHSSWRFQSTGPLRDPTCFPFSAIMYRIISIHRSLAGPDEYWIPAFNRCLDFNPQVPCGTRLQHRR